MSRVALSVPRSRPPWTTPRPWAAGLWPPVGMVVGLLASALAGFLTLAVPAWAQTPEPPVQMTLHPLKGGEMLYRGERTTHMADGRVTVAIAYATPEGRVVQRTEAVYEAESLVPVSYRLLDERSGQEETLRRDGEMVRMTYRESHGKKASEGTVPWKPGVHLASTVGSLVAREWARLVAGETVEFGLLVPSRQDVFTFRLVRDTKREPSAPGRTVVRMEPGTWLVRRLVDPIFMEYDTSSPHRLQRVDGRVSLKTDGGEDQDLRTDYRYGP